MEILYKRERRVADRTIKCYLTVDCNVNCEYCSADIPNVSAERKQIVIEPEVWAEGINRRNRACLLAGGEPFLYPHLAELVNMIEPGIKIEIYSNLVKDISQWIMEVNKKPRFLVSCHPMSKAQNCQWLKNVEWLILEGFSVRFHVIKSEGWLERADMIKSRFPNRVTACDDQRSYIKSRVENSRESVRCKNRLCIYGPDGYRYPCCRLMGLGEHRLEHISEPDGDDWMVVDNCPYFGRCTGCDNMIEGEVTCE